MVTDGSMLYSHPRFCLVHTTDTCTNVQLLPSDNVCVCVCLLVLFGAQCD